MNEQLRQAGLFLRTLFGPYSSGWVEVRMLLKNGIEHGRKQFFVPLPLTRDALRSLCSQCITFSDKGWDVYVGVLPRAEAKGTADYVREAAWFWADLDHKNMDPEEIASAVMGADMVVSSGNGTHAYWSLGSVRPLLAGADRELFVAMLEQMQQDVSAGRADNTADLPRILRVPGTGNWKDRENPLPVTLDRYPSLRPQEPQPEAKGAPAATEPQKPVERPVGPWGESTDVMLSTTEHCARVERLLIEAWRAAEAGTLPPGPVIVAPGVIISDPAYWLTKARERRGRMMRLRGVGWWEVGEGQRLAAELHTFAEWFAVADLAPLLEVESAH